MSQLGETLAGLFQGFDIFGAEVCHWELDTLELLSKLCVILAVGASD